MNLSLKDLPLEDLRHDLKSWGIALEFDEITETAYNQIAGKINAEIARREKTLTEQNHAGY